MDTPLSGMTATLTAGEAAAHAAVRCDQAVFTSVRTPGGEGYRIIAAGTGLTPEEKTEITKRSPSHGGLCGGNAQATGVAFYPLPTGRLCAALSYTAGQEPSGRGGLRVYTRAVLFDRAAFAAFAHNPFNIFRAMETCGLGTPELTPEKTLPPLELPAGTTSRATASTAAVERVGVDWVSFVVQATLTGQCLILAGDDDARDLIEAALLCLPASRRADVSFACGLKFSIGRALSLAGVAGDTTAAERIIRGHPLTLVRLRADVPPPPFERGEWARMMAEHWAEAAWGELLDFTAQPFPDGSYPALERIAALRNEASRASVSGAAEILASAAQRLAQAAADAFEQRLVDDLLRTIRMRLEDLWAQAGAAELTANWPALLALVEQSPETFRHLARLVGRVLRRLSEVSPGTALEHALDLAGTTTARVIAPDLQTVLDAVERWLPRADPASSTSFRKTRDRFRAAFPD